MESPDPAATPLNSDPQPPEGIDIEMKDMTSPDKGTSPPPLPGYTPKKAGKPPDYDSIFGRVQAAKDESTGNVDFAQRVMAVTFCGTICTLISLVIFFTLPIVNLVIGVIYIDNCPLEKFIPIFLIVSGAVGILKGVIQTGLLIVEKLREGEEDESSSKSRVNPVDLILNCFLFVWFIAGSVFVYSNHEEVQYTNKFGDDFCDEVCYKYAFWFITITYIFILLGIVCCSGIAIVACIVGFKKDE